MNNQKSSFFGKIDWLTIILWLALCIIGLFNIHAAVYDPENPGLFDMATRYGKQSMYIASALVIGITILIIDAKFFSSASPVIYAIVILLLIAVLVVGKNVGGNQAWIDLGFFRLQPSEFGKLATCLLLANYLSSQSNKNPNMHTLAIGAGIVLFPVFLVMLQPDTGSALAFFSLIFVFYREGYVNNSLLIFGGLCIVLFVMALLVNAWILIGILAVLAGFFMWTFRKISKLLLT